MRSHRKGERICFRGGISLLVACRIAESSEKAMRKHGRWVDDDNE